MDFKNLDGVQIVILFIIGIAAMIMINAYSGYKNVSELEPNEWYFYQSGEGEYDEFMYTENELDELKSSKITTFMLSTIFSFAGVAGLIFYSFQMKEKSDLSNDFHV